MSACGDTGSPSGSRSRPSWGRVCATAPWPRPSGDWGTLAPRPSVSPPPRPPRPATLPMPTTRARGAASPRNARPARGSGRTPCLRCRPTTSPPNCGCRSVRFPSRPSSSRPRRLLPWTGRTLPPSGYHSQAAISSRLTASSAASPVSGCGSHPRTPSPRNDCVTGQSWPRCALIYHSPLTAAVAVARFAPEPVTGRPGCARRPSLTNGVRTR